jgi:pimeloyl-ACP methyl ester carboxylesterase
MTGDADMAVGRRRLGTGVTLEVAAAGPVGGRCVILLHGFPDMWWTWRGQAAALAAAGYRVLMPVQRGYGGSDKPRGVRAYRLEELATDVAALAETEGAGAFDVVGHDWGGIVAWWTAAALPDRVRRVVALNAPHPGVVRRYMLGHPMQIVQSWYAGFFQVPAVPEMVLRAGRCRLLRRGMEGTARAGAFAEEEWPAYVRAWQTTGALRAMIHYYRALVRRREGPLRVRVRPPALVLWGERDVFEQRGLAEASLALCDAGRVEWFTRATHWVHREEPAGVNAALLQFLAEG